MNKIKKIGKVTIYDDEYVLKIEKDISELQDYLLSRNFNNFLPVIERVDDKNKYQYIKTTNNNKEQIAESLATNIALLHAKTSYHKEISISKKQNIYNNILGNISSTVDYYNKLYSKIEYREFPSPSELLFLTNYNKINDALDYCKRSTMNWFKKVQSSNKERVCLNHGNPNLDHILVNTNSYLISLGNTNFDTPIMDLIKLYKNSYNEIDMREFFNKYEDISPLNDHERDLLFIMISIPKKLEFSNNELINIRNVKEIIDYIYKTEDLIRPYYSIKQEKENKDLD